MPKLKCKIETEYVPETTICVEYRELERFIEVVYGRPFDIIEDIGWRIGNSRPFRLEIDLREYTPLGYDAPLGYNGSRKIVRWKAGRPEAYMLDVILCDMLNRKIIIPGIYIIWIDEKDQRCQT